MLGQVLDLLSREREREDHILDAFNFLDLLMEVLVLLLLEFHILRRLLCLPLRLKACLFVFYEFFPGGELFLCV